MDDPRDAYIAICVRLAFDVVDGIRQYSRAERCTQRELIERALRTEVRRLRAAEQRWCPETCTMVPSSQEKP